MLCIFGLKMITQDLICFRIRSSLSVLQKLLLKTSPLEVFKIANSLYFCVKCEAKKDKRCEAKHEF